MNTLTITGHLGNAPRARTLDNGTPVCDFDVAVNRRYTSNGQTREETLWVNVTAWRGLAQTCTQYLEKGRQVLVTGRLEMADAYIGKDGKPHARDRMTALTVEFLGSGSGATNAPELEGALEAASKAPITEAEIAAAQVAF